MFTRCTERRPEGVPGDPREHVRDGDSHVTRRGRLDGERAGDGGVGDGR